MKALLSLLGDDKVSTEPSDLICYGFDSSRIEKRPAAVVWPECTEDVIKITRFAYEQEIPLIPRGAGTATTGSAVPQEGAIVISLERMDRIENIDLKNLTVTVQPGVINGKLQRELLRLGYFYPPDPASMNFCSIGGNVSTNAGGPRAIKYGVTRDYVRALEAVLPDGRLIRTGAMTAKSVVGYDLKDLLIGSEGTLAVITKIVLSFLPEPESIITLLVVFNDLKASGEAVSNIISAKIIPRTLEFMDRDAIRAVESYRPTGLKEAEALLIIELDGDTRTVQHQSEQVVEICHKLGGSVTVAEDTLSRDKLWEARRAISPALFSIAPTKINEDVVVPRARIPDMLLFLRSLSEETGLSIVNFGHAGDGNIHVNIMVDDKDEEQYRKAQALVRRIFEETLRLGGSISGEHGIGITKAEYLDMEIGQNEMDLMRGIKKLFDHKNIMNPKKVLL